MKKPAPIVMRVAPKPLAAWIARVYGRRRLYTLEFTLRAPRG